MQHASKLKIILCLCFLVVMGFALSPTQKKGWRPNKVPSGTHFEGSLSCKECHANKVTTHAQTMMGQALEPVATSIILQKFPKLSFQSGTYLTEIIRQGENRGMPDKLMFSNTKGLYTKVA
jgi:hypothetical protein